MTFSNEIYCNEDKLCELLRKHVGRVFKVKKSLDYPHGRIKSKKLLSVTDGVRNCVCAGVEFEATFTDGFRANYCTLAQGFYLDCLDQL